MSQMLGALDVIPGADALAEMAETLEALARLESEAGDAQRAGRLVVAARAIREASDVTARRRRGRRTRALVGWESLTPAEEDVALLVAEGLSNPEIVARLYISRNTVKFHLRHVYMKLGVGSRVELTKLALGRAA